MKDSDRLFMLEVNRDFKKIISIVWQMKEFEIELEDTLITISGNTWEFDNFAGLDVEVLADALDKTPQRMKKEARVLVDTIKTLLDLTALGYCTQMLFAKKKNLYIEVFNNFDKFTYEIKNVSKHSYSSFVSKLVKINKDLKGIDF